MKYLHGGDIYRNPVEYDFSVNINPLGMPEAGVKAAMEGVLLSSRYPDAFGEELKIEIAKQKKILPSQIILGNGAAELIYGLCHGRKGNKGLAAAPCFQEYEEAFRSAGGEMKFWKLHEEDDFLLKEDFLSAITEEIDVVFLCNPNNPTGTLLSRQFLMKIAEKCEETKTWFCLDECFLPFLMEEEMYSMIPWIQKFPHMIILRAFTKIYGMPGLRLGYGISSNEEILEKIRASIQPWNTSIPAQMAGVAALKDTRYLEETRNLIQRETKYLLKELSKGLADKIYHPSVNYIFFKSRKDLKERLLEQGILIRSCSNFRNLKEGFFRIGIRTRKENQELIERWREIR